MRAGPALVAVVVVLLGLSSGACRSSGADSPPADPGPTIVVAGAAVPVSRLTGAVEGLCTALRQAPDNARAVEVTFYDRSHDALHVIARGLEDVDRQMAAAVLETMQAVEADLSGGLASGDRLAADVARLVDATRSGMARLEVPTKACDK